MAGADVDVNMIDENTIRELCKKAIEEGTEEAKYLLKLSRWTRPGPSFEDNGDFKVVLGEVREIPLSHRYDYPTVDETTYLIIPLTVPVIIIERHGNDYEGEYVEHTVVHVFTKDGWKSVEVQ